MGGVAFAIIFASLQAPVAGAQSCEDVDVDGDGTLTPLDSVELSRQLDEVNRCLATDLRGLRGCQGYDLDRNGAIETSDYGIVDRALAQLVGCLGPVRSARSQCAWYDWDGNRRIELTDASLLFAIRRRTVECLGEPIQLLSCEAVDFDGDLRISLLDATHVFTRMATVEDCLSAESPAPAPADSGLWVDRERVRALPTWGPAWDRLFSEAMRPVERPDLSNLDDQSDTHALARALVGIRLDDQALIASVRDTLARVVSERSELGGATLPVARNLVAFVLAADLIELGRIAPELDAAFRVRLEELRHVALDGRTLITTHADRPNNWGTHAGATRIAIALYLGDEPDLAEAVEIHRAWLGEPSAYAGFRYGETSWQADPFRPIGVNPRGARRFGIDLDGALPEEMRRGSSLADPPVRTGYAWEALQGATVATELLARHGYPDAWSWGDDALRRAADYLYRLDDRYGGWAATGDDRWNVWLINGATGSRFPLESGVSPGKNMGFTDWTHAASSAP